MNVIELFSSFFSGNQINERRLPIFHRNYKNYRNLLIKSEPPNGYIKHWITKEHNKFRRIVRFNFYYKKI